MTTATRKLAAILAADVAGYSRLTGADEEGTVARLGILRAEAIDPAIASSHGRIVKTTGDGMLVEFASVVDAVRAAIAIQSDLAARNATEPTDRRLEFRIGIHLGDVMVQPDGDLMGDGVNIAARLEGIAEPGGICLSEDAVHQVQGKIDIAFSDLGPQRLKNIAQQIRAYRVQLGSGRPRPRPRHLRNERTPRERLVRIVVIAAAIVLIIVASRGASWYFGSRNSAVAPPAVQHAATPASQSARRFSIVVLPFTNLSGDPSQDYFADGITENLTTELSHIRGSFVIARNTAVTYKGKSIDAKQLGRELGVRYVLEGSVQRDENRVRVNAQLIDAETGAHLWADRFDEDKADLFKLQDEIVGRLANSLGYEMFRAEAQRSAQSRNPDAIDITLHADTILAQAMTIGGGKEGALQARTLYEQALKLDPDNVSALVGAAQTYFLDIAYGRADPALDEPAKAAALLDRVLDLNPDDAPAHAIRAALFLVTKRPQDAVAEGQKAISLDPSSAFGYAWLAWAQSSLDQCDQAIANIDQALQLSPRDPGVPFWHYVKGTALLGLHRFPDAIAEFRTATDGGFGIAYSGLAAAYALAGQDAEAKDAVTRFKAAFPYFTVALLRQNIEAPPLYWEGLRKAGFGE